MKKAFTLIELAVSAVLLTILVALALKTYLDKKENEALNNLVNSLVTITKTYVLNTQVGYLNGSGGYCSDDNTFNKIDAWRTIKCINLLNKPFEAYKKNSGENSTDTCSYIIIPAKNYLEGSVTTIKVTNNFNNTITKKEGINCKVFFASGDNGNELYARFDCSYIKSPRKRALFEKLLDNAFKKNFASIYKETKFNWKFSSYSDCSGNLTGNSSDGQLQITLKLN